MCGLTGVLDLKGERELDPNVLTRMMDAIVHRGPDSAGRHREPGLSFGFRRLAIIDLAGGDQPLVNEDGSLVLVCNGEIFNHVELREQLTATGHRFATGSDCEVLLHLYEDYGDLMLEHVNGQFAFALWDRRRRRLLMARDPFGIAPLFHTTVEGQLIFASEIKSLLQHPAVRADLDLVGLDQVVCFPGLVSPRTMFRNIAALPPGHKLVVQNGQARLTRYWDLAYPQLGAEGPRRSDASYVEEFAAIFRGAVARRLRADVPVGVYISGGLDSSLVSATARDIRGPAEIHSFGVTFDDKAADERRYQELMVSQLRTIHHEIRMRPAEIAAGLERMVFHAECAVKESYNTCAMRLAETTRASGVRVVLGGEGADELFAGYPGYRFDAHRRGAPPSAPELAARQTLWGDPTTGYERDYSAFADRRRSLFSADARAQLESASALSSPVADGARLRNRHPIHQRSYLDVRLRLGDHLLGDHGDRMLMAHGIEGRYPFLDREVVEFARQLPPDLKLRDFQEKYVVKQIAGASVPREIVEREKFGFYASSMPDLLQASREWIEDTLSYDNVRRQGVFCPDTVEALKRSCLAPGARLDPRADDDLLMVVLSTELWRSLFAAGSAAQTAPHVAGGVEA